MKDLSQLATSVLQEVEKGQVVKEAAATYKPSQPLTTETGKMLQKVAELVRIAGKTKISYTDLERFRKTYDV